VTNPAETSASPGTFPAVAVEPVGHRRAAAAHLDSSSLALAGEAVASAGSTPQPALCSQTLSPLAVGSADPTSVAGTTAYLPASLRHPDGPPALRNAAGFDPVEYSDDLAVPAEDSAGPENFVVLENSVTPESSLRWLPVPQL